MTFGPAHPLTDFVGRERELRRLEAALDASLAGSGRVVMLAGEPGIGKTETARHLVTHAGRRGAVILRGGCYEGGWQPAFGPWAEALNEWARLRPQRLQQLLGPGASPLAHLLPGRAIAVEGPRRELSPDEERFRLYSAVADLLLRMSLEAPVVLLLDDLHWAERDSLELLRHVGRAAVQCRLLVLGTYRDIGLDRGHPLIEVLGALRRETEYEHLHLRGFSEQEVADYLNRVAGQPLPAALVPAIHAETAGNPLYVGELVRHLLEEDTLGLRAGQSPTNFSLAELGSPTGVRHVLSRRLARLSEATNSVLRTAAAFSGAFELAVLRDLVELPEARLLDCLDEAEHAGLIRPAAGPGEIYEFAHAIVRHTIYDELTAARKVRLHRAIAEGLERRWPEPQAQAHLAELAHHFLRAAASGVADEAVEYSRRAAEHAVSHLAYEDGARLYLMALQALDLTQPPDATVRCELLLGLGDAQMRSGASSEARSTFQLAADAARRLGSPALLARAALGLGAQVEAHFSDARLVALLEEALACLEEQDSPLRVRVLGCLAMALYFSASADRRASLSRDALEMGRRVGDRGALAYALGARHFALWGPGDVEDRLASATELMRLAEATGDVDLAMQAHAWRIMDLLELGDTRAAFAEIDTHTAHAHELQQPIYTWRSASWQATRALMQGRFEDGERLARQALAIGQGLSSLAMAWFGMQMFTSRWNQGRLQDLGEVISIAERYPAIPAWRVVIVIGHLERGNEAQARAELDAIAADDFGGLPRDANWLIGLALLAEVAALLGDATRAARLYELLLPYATRCVVVRFASACWGSAARYLGLLAATTRRWTEAVQHFEQALAMNTRMGAWPLVAHTEHEYARMLLARGGRADRARAHDLLEQALGRARELGMARLAEQVLAVHPTSGAAPDRRTLAAPPAGLGVELARLTPREREIVRLVAGGLTNRQIADALVIAPGTAALHVEHIRNKLGFRSRAQVAAWAAEHGLRSNPEPLTGQD